MKFKKTVLLGALARGKDFTMGNEAFSLNKEFPDRGNILVVDDTPQNLDLLLEILTEDGFEVRPAKSGRMALESARTIPPELILLDVMMPEMGGFEVCRRLMVSQKVTSYFRMLTGEKIDARICRAIDFLVQSMGKVTPCFPCSGGGLTFCESIKKEEERTRDVPVIFISALEEVVDKVRAFEVGGVDFISKPFQAEEVLARVRTQLALRRTHVRLEQQKAQLEREIAERKKTEKELSLIQEHMSGILEKKLRHPEVFRNLVTKSEKMRSIFQYIEALACSSEPVLITGESGVGKELIAKAIHDVCDPPGPWVPVNIAGLDDNVFSDTLFGHVKGAFTGADHARAGMIERAAGGTLFLDEIGDLNPVSQVKLLRLIQEKEFIRLGSDKAEEVKARIVVATNVNLEKKQKTGEFRKDLYFRLFTHQIRIPPLRERPEDIPVLLDFFLEEAAREMGKKKPTPPEELLVLLANYPFPGNIRELRAMVFNAVSVHKSRKLSMDLFQEAMGISRKESDADLEALKENPMLTFHERLPTLKEAASLLVVEAIKRTGGNQSMAARLLGITQPALSSRLKKMEDDNNSKGDSFLINQI